MGGFLLYFQLYACGLGFVAIVFVLDLLLNRRVDLEYLGRVFITPAIIIPLLYCVFLVGFLVVSPFLWLFGKLDREMKDALKISVAVFIGGIPQFGLTMGLAYVFQSLFGWDLSW